MEACAKSLVAGKMRYLFSKELRGHSNFPISTDSPRVSVCYAEFGSLLKHGWVIWEWTRESSRVAVRTHGTSFRRRARRCCGARP